MSRAKYAVRSWKGSGWSTGTCTLLGPEGPGRHLWVSIGPLDLVVTDHNALFEGLIRHTGYRPYFENYTVDASILDSNSNVRIT